MVARDVVSMAAGAAHKFITTVVNAFVVAAVDRNCQEEMRYYVQIRFHSSNFFYGCGGRLQMSEE